MVYSQQQFIPNINKKGVLWAGVHFIPPARPWSLGIGRGFLPTIYDWYNSLSMPGLQLNHVNEMVPWPQFYQTRSAWSMDQGSTKKCSAVHNFVPTVTKFCVMWEGLSLPQDTKFGNCRDEIVDRRVIFIWSLIHGSSWSGLIKVGPGKLSSKGIGMRPK